MAESETVKTQQLMDYATLQDLVSGTFLQTLPDLVTPLIVTEGAIFISTQLSTDALSALQKVWVLI